MKRKWLYLGVLIASLLQFFVERLWVEFLFKDTYSDLQLNLRISPEPLLNFLSKVAFAFVVGFFYLHVPAEKRNVKTGATIGAILGFLIALYRYLDWYGSLNVSVTMIMVEIVRTIILAVICGLTISFIELKTNRRTKPDSL